MRPLTSIKKRAAQSAERDAASAGEPAAQDRAALRRHARALGERREALVRDLGALIVDLHRLDRERPDLVKAKAGEIAQLDAELQGLAQALGEDVTQREAVARGAAVQCRSCGTPMSHADGFCAHCGAAARKGAEAPAESATERRPLNVNAPVQSL
ncbi:MAG: hypothetical protein QOE08_1008 [Thermoleophilaceae bacterium]|jgi:rubrerythrin|nr:hypothetical protein [Thermoleophilaceae bacterium]